MHGGSQTQFTLSGPVPPTLSTSLSPTNDPPRLLERTHSPPCLATSSPLSPDSSFSLAPVRMPHLVCPYILCTRVLYSFSYCRVCRSRCRRCWFSVGWFRQSSHRQRWQPRERDRPAFGFFRHQFVRHPHRTCHRLSGSGAFRRRRQFVYPISYVFIYLSTPVLSVLTQSF